MPKLANHNNCTGCTACACVCPKQCIKMEYDREGFLYPSINLELCIDCDRCTEVCLVLKNDRNLDHSPIAYAAYSKDDEVRMDSSSGGIFSEISQIVLNEGGCIFGAAYNEDFEVYHCLVETAEELSKLRGAKYSQSILGDTFSDILQRLKSGQKVLFSGTPCQVAGLKAFLGKDYDNLICIDFVCHGIPSPMVWKKYVEYRANQDADGSKLLSINLRSKVSGWSQYKYSNVFKYENGKTYQCESSQSLFMKLFVGDYVSRKSCSACPFKGYQRDSDITLGDFWGIWDILPEMDDNRGTSMVLIQSNKGKKYWDKIYDHIICQKVSLEDSSIQNPSMLVSSSANQKREETLNDICNGHIAECKALFIEHVDPLHIRFKNKCKRIVSRFHM